MRGVLMSRDPDQEIGPKEAPYMHRWVLWRKERLGGLYLHLFLEDDDDRALHDHPYSSLSIMLGGEVREVFSESGWNPGDPSQHSARMIRMGDVVYRSAQFSHRIELRSYTAMTLFIIGPRIREWGFHCPKGWRGWREYCNTDNPNQIGRGCD
jgi:hypothetical protein